MLFSNFSIYILFIQKISVVYQFVTYSYVYVYDNISKDNHFKFPKPPNPHSLGLGMPWNREIGRASVGKECQY